MITELRVYWASNPLFNNVGNNFTIGAIDDSGVLTQISNNDTDLNIILIEPSSAQLVNNNNTIIVAPNSQTNISLRFQLIYQGYSQYFSYVLVPPYTNMTLSQLINTYKTYLPKNVYSTSKTAPSSIKQKAIATTLFQLYNNSEIDNPSFIDLQTVLTNMYPISGNPNWELFLTGNNRLLYEQTTQYGKLLQLIYQLEINNNTNPYWLCYNISQYIYYWLGIQKYVYVQEGIIPNISIAFILNSNALDACVFNGSDTGNKDVIYYVLTDGPGTITSDQQNQIQQFARQITRAGMTVQVIFTESALDLGLTINLGNTYWKDPRQQQTYCIEFNPNILDQALGLSGGYSGNISNITDFTLTLNPGGDTDELGVGGSYEVIITPTYSTPTVLPKPIIQYTEFFSEDTTLLSTSMIDGVEYFNALEAGTVTVNVYLGTIFKSYTYNIISKYFILDVSTLDGTDVLAP